MLRSESSRAEGQDTSCACSTIKTCLPAMFLNQEKEQELDSISETKLPLFCTAVFKQCVYALFVILMHGSRQVDFYCHYIYIPGKQQCTKPVLQGGGLIPTSALCVRVLWFPLGTLVSFPTLKASRLVH